MKAIIPCLVLLGLPDGLRLGRVLVRLVEDRGTESAGRRWPSLGGLMDGCRRCYPGRRREKPDERYEKARYREKSPQGNRASASGRRPLTWLLVAARDGLRRLLGSAVGQALSQDGFRGRGWNPPDGRGVDDKMSLAGRTSELGCSGRELIRRELEAPFAVRAWKEHTVFLQFKDFFCVEAYSTCILMSPSRTTSPSLSSTTAEAWTPLT